MQKKKKNNSYTSPHAHGDADAAAAGLDSDGDSLKVYQLQQEEEKAAAEEEEEEEEREEEEEDEEEDDEDEEEDLESPEEEDGEGTSRAQLVVREEAIGSDVKQGRKAGGGGLLLPWLPSVCCRVEGCREDLWLAGDYHRKHRVCKTHAAADKVFINQQEQRFCQQCSRFHTLAEFDEGKRSCRKRLAYHNERRRRHQSDSLVKCSGDATLSKGGTTRTSDFTAEQKVQRMKSSSEISSSPVTFIGIEQNHDKSLKPEQPSMGEPFPLPKSLKSKSVRNDAEGQSIRSKSKRSKESEKHWIVPRKLDRHSSEDEVQEDVAGVSPLLLQAKLDSKTYGGAAGDTFDPQYGSSLRVGIELGDGIILPPLTIKREGKLVLLQEWPGGGADGEDAQRFQLRKDSLNKKEWQNGDQETLFHCLWDCPKVQPVWKWAGRALSKIRGSKVSLEWKQAVLGDKLGGWALPETISVWRLLRGIILGQVWHARKGKVYSGKQWTPGQIIRSTWVDLMMYAMQEWLEVLKAKGSLKQEEAQLLRTRFDKKWLVNGFVGRRTEWSMSWKDSYEVLLD